MVVPLDAFAMEGPGKMVVNAQMIDSDGVWVRVGAYWYSQLTGEAKHKDCGYRIKEVGG